MLTGNTKTQLPASGFNYNIECQDNLEYIGRLKEGSVQLVVTSPPYNVGKSYEKRTSIESYLDGQKKLIDKVVPLLAPTGNVCWQVGNHVDGGEVFPLDCLLYPLFKAHGLHLRNRIVWTFGHGLHCKNRFSGRHETILWFSRDQYTFNLDPIRVPSKYPGKKHYKGKKKGELSGNPLGKNPEDVWDIPNVKSNHVEKTEHPCQFPIALAERLVLGLSNRGDCVFDPYLGSGSTAIAALKHGRVALGCDVEKQYIEIARERVALLEQGKLEIRALNQPVWGST